MTIPFAPKLPPRKGIAHAPLDLETIDSETRETLLKAIARSRGWMETILSDKTKSFDNIAAHEGLAERHVRAWPSLRSCRRKSFRRSPTAPFLRV